MQLRKPWIVLACGLVLLAGVCGDALRHAAAEKPNDPQTAKPVPAAAPADKHPSAEVLANYVAAPDASYGWVKRREGKLAGGTYTELTLTSQTWKKTVWKHQLFIFRPETVRDGSRALLWISGGAWKADLGRPVKDGVEPLPPQATMAMAMAKEIHAPVAVLLQVPQQPIFNGLYEDQIIAYTFAQYVMTQDNTWPLLLPMVKSAVRAMDAVQAFCKQEWSLDVSKFTVTGASKRGWTTWLSAAIDQRVESLAPMVIDLLNMAPQMDHQLKTWGKLSEELHDYTNLGVQTLIKTPPGQSLQAIVDPYRYRETLTQPKLIVLATNDRYWPLDALNLYWDGLAGEKHILYVPNQGHGIKDMPRVVGTISALHRQAAGELKLPKMTWDLSEADGKLVLSVRSDIAPQKVEAWTASSMSGDFRDSRWDSHPAKLVDGAYRYELPLPAKGKAAMFGEAVFATDSLPFYQSTNVKIVGAKK